MNPLEHLAIIGSGPSAIYLLKHLLDEAVTLGDRLGEVSIFEKNGPAGMGMPYSPRTTDRWNMANISSEEMPSLPVSFGDWLRSREPETLRELHLEGVPIRDSEVYSRLALGRYLHSQYREIIERLEEVGIAVHEYPGCEVLDIHDSPEDGRVTLVTREQGEREFDRVVIATGHRWGAEDDPDRGYYVSPWPIHKILPPEGGHHNFTIGTLGASLSAFDVVSSLAHRHGTFKTGGGGELVFEPHPGTEDFRIVMHSDKGLLPHLQFDQDELFREIYRHVRREELLALLDGDGFLRIGTYFDSVCRPALRRAFEKDGMPELVELLGRPEFGLEEFAAKMTGEHDYGDAFEGMRLEMGEAEESVFNHKPIHWKEVIDDLMYTLNFHAELMPAEDHILLQAAVMPFLLNVVAAMPLSSGNTILALHGAGKLDMVAGRVTVLPEGEGMTKVEVEREGAEKYTLDYRMFIDCSGQKPVQPEDYPFPSLVSSGTVRRARAPFANSGEGIRRVPEEKKDRLLREDGEVFYSLGGVDIDGACRVIGRDGKPNPRIHDIAFAHASGVRPYSYGLQACSHTSAIVVAAWVEEMRRRLPPETDTSAMTEIFEKALS